MNLCLRLLFVLLICALPIQPFLPYSSRFGLAASRNVLFASRSVTTTDDSVEEDREGACEDTTVNRKSVVPLTVNAISSGLLSISQGRLSSSPSPLDHLSSPPLQVFKSASSLAVNKIVDYEGNSEDGIGGVVVLTEGEKEEVVGRVVGVFTRLEKLVEQLVVAVNGEGGEWVRKYGEEGRFGLTPSEASVEGLRSSPVSEVLKSDALLRANRAETLLALFILTVEQPAYVKAGREKRPLDFVEEDRSGILRRFAKTIEEGETKDTKADDVMVGR